MQTLEKNKKIYLVRVLLTLACVLLLAFIFGNSLTEGDDSSKQSAGVVSYVKLLSRKQRSISSFFKALKGTPLKRGCPSFLFSASAKNNAIFPPETFIQKQRKNSQTCRDRRPRLSEMRLQRTRIIFFSISPQFFHNIRLLTHYS